MESEPLNSRIPLPIDLPSSGRRFGPKTIRAITRTMAISSGPTFGSTETFLSLVMRWGSAPEAAAPCLAFRADLSPGAGGVCGLCQLADDGEELARLPDEQSVLGECPGRAHRRALGLGRPDDRDGRELP